MFNYNRQAMIRCARCGRPIMLGFARFPANEKFAGEAVAKAFCAPHDKGLTFDELERKATMTASDLRVTRHLHEVRGARQRIAA
jgi:phosphopantetheinyl transferase (holo-ACP synthase)